MRRQASTMSGPRAFGRISTSIMYQAGSPRILAAATYSRSRSSRVWLRTRRATCGEATNVTATTMFNADGPNFIMMKFGPSALNIVVAVTFVASPQVARLVRSQTLELREREYVAAAKMRGEPAWYIMLVEILPNARGPLIVDACLRMGYTAITIGILGFLGLGLRPPDPDWGGMIGAGYSYVMGGQVHMALAPALALSSLVVGLSLLADGLREISLRD